jgi:hypothetical protein
MRFLDGASTDAFSVDVDYYCYDAFVNFAVVANDVDDYVVATDCDDGDGVDDDDDSATFVAAAIFAAMMTMMIVLLLLMMLLHLLVLLKSMLLLLMMIRMMMMMTIFNYNSVVFADLIVIVFS